MPKEPDHLQRTRDNLDFLIANQSSTHLHWLVTTTYYTALHLIDAHLSKLNIHPPNHDKRKEVIQAASPFKGASVTSGCYSSYCALEGLSRMARYMCNEKNNGNSDQAHPTGPRHLKEALRHLTIVINELESRYKFGIEVPRISVASAAPEAVAPEAPAATEEKAGTIIKTGTDK